ncbi:MAG: DUF2262 domain-containing protein [Spirochaetales bacterium]|jgi:hypothetical protein|nr:DUF2262 domain-containing protein [Spirochaetales bacterium]
MKMNNEIKEFNAKFDKKIMEIQIVTGSSAFGGAKGPGEELWEASIDITAWKLINDKNICGERYFLRTKADMEYLNELRGKILPDTICSVKVRQKENKFLLVEITGKGIIDNELENILKEQTKPVIYKDKTLGKFVLDKRFDEYTGKIKWNNKRIKMAITKYTGEMLDKVFIAANEFIREQEMWDRRIKEFAANKLAKLKNTSWLEEDEEEITADEFIKKIKAESINISLKNKFEVYFDDGEIFWGHSIVVSGNFEKGPLRADIAG